MIFNRAILRVLRACVLMIRLKHYFFIFSSFLESIESNARYHNRFEAGGNVAIIGLSSINWGRKIDL